MEQRSDTHRTNRTTRHRLTGVASAYIETYMTPGGASTKPSKRYRVRARAGRSGAPLLHLGSFPTRSEANIRLKWASELLAAGIRPRLDMLFVTDDSPTLTVAAAVDRYLKQRPDFADRTRDTYRSLMPHISRAIGPKDVWHISPDDVRELVRITSAGVGPDATRSIRGILAGALDHAGVKPNPARDSSVKLPRRTSRRMDVPTAEHVEKILRFLPADLLLPVAMLEATGARISELLGVEAGDVDHANGRLRLVGKGDKPRIVPLPPELGALMPRVSASQRSSAGKVWPGLTADRVRKAIGKACTDAGIKHYTPHSFRRRFASRHVQIGTPITQTSEWLGHAKTSMTHDVYARTLVNGDTAEAWRSVIHD